MLSKKRAQRLRACWHTASREREQDSSSLTNETILWLVETCQELNDEIKDLQLKIDQLEGRA